MRQTIAQKTFDQERSLYHLEHADVISCAFQGPADGESTLKEARDITVKDCSFSLRYPLWHVHGFTLLDSKMDEKTRAALWYDQDGMIKNLHSTGIKAVRECHNLSIIDSTFVSPEFGWKSSDLLLDHVDITSEYAFLDSKNVTFKNSKLQSKYAFQYMGTAAKKVEASALKNIRLRAADFDFAYEEMGSLKFDRIYLNFSDPWPKKRHWKRRLTTKERLLKMGALLKDAGEIVFKSDNVDLYAFTLEQAPLAGFSILDATANYLLLPEDVMTEYEKNFRSQGKAITRIRMAKSTAKSKL